MLEYPNLASLSLLLLLHLVSIIIATATVGVVVAHSMYSSAPSVSAVYVIALALPEHSLDFIVNCRDLHIVSDAEIMQCLTSS